MKKVITIAFVFLLLAGIPTISSMSIKNTPNILSKLPNINGPKISTLDDIPDWAVGNFTAVWGLNINGQPGDPLGLVIGYYGEHLFAGLITNTSAPNGWIWGIRFSIFMFGMVANIEGEEQAPFVGLGLWNEEEFYYRIMSIVGPTFYIYGVYTPFE